jgi:hypothetical protein
VIISTYLYVKIWPIDPAKPVTTTFSEYVMRLSPSQSLRNDWNWKLGIRSPGGKRGSFSIDMKRRNETEKNDRQGRRGSTRK